MNQITEMVSRQLRYITIPSAPRHEKSHKSLHENQQRRYIYRNLQAEAQHEKCYRSRNSCNWQCHGANTMDKTLRTSDSAFVFNQFIT